MAKTVNTDQELKDLILGLPFHKLKMVLDNYTEETGVSFKKEINTIITNSLQSKLIEHEINIACHKCGSISIVKRGKRADGVQRYACKDCFTNFTLFSGTILEKTRWHWDAWVKVLEMTINHLSLDSMHTALINDYACEGINRKTIWLWRLKLVHALASIEAPKLTGIVQIDETFIRESQKGSRKLESYLIRPNIRKPRYGYQPSKLGSMGPEFATVVTAIDDRGYCVCKLTTLGKATEDILVDLFEDHINNPAYICSDANSIYKRYTEIFDIPHYIKPSNYKKILKENGYVSPDETNPTKAAKTRANNDKLLDKLYFHEKIDCINNKGGLSYSEFTTLRDTLGLNLGRVNELHKDIKKYINKDMTNVSTKYLEDYIGFFTYIRNWRVENGRYPTSLKDAEQILVEILKTKVNFTMTDVENRELTLPKPSTRYVTLLAQNTEKTRIISENEYFKFNEEDGVRTFNKRAYLSNQPEYKLYQICKECKLTKYRNLASWSLISTILQQPNIEDIILKLISKDQHINISQEDLDAIEADIFRTYKR